MNISRRGLVKAVSLLAAAYRGTSLPLFADQTITPAEVARFLDTKDPERHCGERHDHRDDSYDDWRGALEWSAADCGHNEGAPPVIKLAIQHSLSYPDLMRGCTETEAIIPQIDELIKDPDFVEKVLKFIPTDKAALISSDQITELKNALKEGRSFTEILTLAPDDAAGEVWRRKSMMRFARTLAMNGSVIPATAIATASQWHNCHAFRCLLRHPNEVALWLQR